MIAPATFTYPGLAFDHPTHTYRLHGDVVLSVTQALGVAFAGLLGERFWREEHRQRGQAVHACIALHAQDDLDEGTIHPSVWPYFQAFLRFQDVEKFRFLHTEQFVCDEDLRYAGALDVFGWFEGPRRAPIGVTVADIIDFKSGHLPWTVGMQTAAYARPVRQVYPGIAIRRWCLQLKADGTYYLECLSSGPDARTHETDFLSALRVAQIRRSRDQAVTTTIEDW